MQTVKRLAVAMTALLLAVSVYLVTAAVLAIGDVERGVGRLEEANATLGATPSGWSPQRASAALRLQRQAEREIASATSRLSGNPLLRTLLVVPGIGDQVRGTLDLGSSAEDAAAATGDLIQVAQAYEHDGQGAPTGPRLLRVLADSSRPFADARSHLDRADARLRADLRRHLLPPLDRQVRGALDRLQAPRRSAAAGAAAATYLPVVLASGGSRSYLLLFPNPSELRPVGGFVGAVGTITVAAGAPTAMAVHGEEAYDGRYGQRFPIPVALGRRLSFPNGSLDIGDAGWDPNYPSSAQLSEEMYRSATGLAVDGTIAVDPYAIAALLRITGPIDVAPYGTFTADTFYAKLDQIVNVQKGPDSGKRALPPIAQALVRRVLAAPLDRWMAMLIVGAEQAHDRHLQLYLHDAATAGAVRAAGYDGALVDPGGGTDYLLVVDANVGGTKGDAYVRKSMQERVEVNPNGITRHELILRYEYPAGTRDLTVAPGGDTAYRDFVRVYLPETSDITAFDQTVDGRPGSIEENRIEHGKRSVGIFFRLPAGQTTELRLFYSTPLDVRQSYRLYVQKQAGITARPTTIEISHPDGILSRRIAADHDEEVAIAW